MDYYDAYDDSFQPMGSNDDSSPSSRPFVQRLMSSRQREAPQAVPSSSRVTPDDHAFATRPPASRYSRVPPSNQQAHQEDWQEEEPLPFVQSGQQLRGHQRNGPKKTSAPHGIPLRPVSELPDIYRRCFRFPAFNAVQSKCFDAIYHSDENAVIGAPTGAGKTVLFELGIIRVLQNDSKGRIVYMAPTKSLCNERYEDWKAKFAHLGVTCTQVTGDSNSASAFAELKRSHVIVTTPEKWDSMTRRWRDHDKLLGQLRLFCMDEVHMLNEDRGSVLEVVVSRMKTMGTMLRFIALSATVPNIEDVASWLGANGSARLTAHTFTFDDEFRPCPLQKLVYGYPTKGQNDFAFGASLNHRLTDLIVKHASGKPVIIFCPTRKSCLEASEIIAKDYQKLMEARKAPWSPPKRAINYQDKRLLGVAVTGVAIHHAGLAQHDRQSVEQAFIQGHLHVICTTSTLAVGVNLPARMVVLRGTKTWDANTASSTPYSDLDIMQMIGRAGRPQYDTEGVAVIMTEQDSKAKYDRLVRSETILESSLHKNLIEHVNSEIALHTITNTDSALEWLRSTFLYVRASLNPRYYGVADDDSPDKRLEELVAHAVSSLASNGIVSDIGGLGRNLKCTSLGEILSRYFVIYPTFIAFCAIKDDASLKEVLQTLAAAKEFNSLRIRAGEKLPLLEICKRNEIRFPLKKIATVADKVFVLIQVVLGAIPLAELKSDSSDTVTFGTHTTLIFKDANRLAKWASTLSRLECCGLVTRTGMIEVLLERRDAVTLKPALELSRSLAGRAWDNSSNVLRQLDTIGEKAIKILSDAGIDSLRKVANAKPRQLEMILNRQPPYGTKLASQARSFPSLRIETSDWQETPTDDGNLCSANVTVSLDNDEVAQVKTSYAQITLFTATSDGQWIDFRRMRLDKLAQSPKSFIVRTALIKPSQKISISAAVDIVAGSEVRITLSPTSAGHKYPRPRFTAIEPEEERPFEQDNEAIDELDEDPPRHAPSTSKRKDALIPARRRAATFVVERVPRYRLRAQSVSPLTGLEHPPAPKKVKAAKAPIDIEPEVQTLNIVRAPSKAKPTTSKPTEAPVAKPASFSSMLSNLPDQDRSSSIRPLPKASKPRPNPRPAAAQTTKRPLELDEEDADLPDAADIFLDDQLDAYLGSNAADTLFDHRSPSPPPCVPSKRALSARPSTNEILPSPSPKQPRLDATPPKLFRADSPARSMLQAKPNEVEEVTMEVDEGEDDDLADFMDYVRAHTVD